MSKSLEALDKLCKVKIYQKEASAYDYLGKEIYKEEINAIKQDLERLEQFENENQELKELQELNKQGLWNLKQENKKLKKIIEILKDKVAD